MTADTLMNVTAVAGAAVVFVFGGWTLLTIREVIERYVHKLRAPKPPPEPRIIFRVGYGPPSPTNPKWKDDRR